MTRLWVGILPSDTTDDKLLAFFVENGITPESATVVRDHTTGESRRIGSVDVIDADSAIASTDGKKMGDYALKVFKWRL